MKARYDITIDLTKGQEELLYRIVTGKQIGRAHV